MATAVKQGKVIPMPPKPVRVRVTHAPKATKSKTEALASLMAIIMGW